MIITQIIYIKLLQREGGLTSSNFDIVSIYISLLLQNVISVGSIIQACLSALNILSYSFLYLNSVSFYISFISRIIILEQSLINLLLKLQNPKKLYTSLIFFRDSYNLITLIFFRLILVLVIPIIKPRNLTFFL